MPAGHFVKILQDRVAATPDQVAFVFRDEETETGLTYAELDQRARALAAALAERGAPGDRVLLACSPGMHYVAGFFGCLYAGMIAVPVYPPTEGKAAERMLRVLLNCEARTAVVDRAIAGRIRSWPGRLASVGLVLADEIPLAAADTWRPVAVRPSEPAFLQYTSGSTADPKGVMVGHDNLVHNSATMAKALGFGPDTVSVSWLPPYHDMGLIGGILQPVHSGFRAVLLPPMSFLRRPARWLTAISDHRATASVAPAFGYAECARRLTDEEVAALDLSSWRTALVGAEPIPPATLDAFADRFGSAGFRRTSFYPCYGLAEATLFVTGGERGQAPVISETTGTQVVACGQSHGADTVLVVDQETRVSCADGVVGEIWVSGPTVAHGYWRDPGKTTETFHARLTGDDSRTFLRTGDLGYFGDGQLHITGRAKELIVLRGRNHHPQDIEWTAELAHASLPRGRGAAFAVGSATTEHAVLVQEVGAGFRQESAAEVVAAIRAAVTVAHGIDLHDVVLVGRGSIPRTSSGKTRRLAMRDRYARGDFTRIAQSGQFSAPVDPALHRAVAAVLDRSAGRVDPQLPLVAQGLDSVRAVEVKSLLLNDFALDVALPELLGDATTDTLARMPRNGNRRRPDGPRAEGSAASSGQARLWLQDRLGKGEAFRVGAGLRIRGPLDLPALHSALNELVARHEALRTTLELATDGTIRQRVHPPTPLRLPVIELSAPDEDARHREMVDCYWRELGGAFDLGSLPLLRVAVARFAPDDAALLLSAHHVTVDGWSMTVLWHELSTLYSAFSTGRPAALPTPEMQYRDLPAGDAEPEFWRRYLNGAPEFRLSPDRPRTGGADKSGAISLEVPAELTKRLRELAAAQNATLHMVLVAAFAAVLARWRVQPDVVFASVWANRSDPFAANVVGFLAQALPIRVDTSGDVSFRGLVARTRSCCLDVLAHQHTPVELALGGRAQDTVAFGLRPALPAWRGALAVEAFDIPPSAAQFELSIDLVETPDDALRGWAVFAAELFDESTVRRVFSAFLTLLESAVDDPDAPVAALPLIDRAERERIAGFGAPHTVPPEPPPVTVLFESQVDSSPDADALVEGGTRISYRELDERANRLARYLIASGVRRDDVVGVYLPHSIDTVVCLLAVFKAGAAYLPMDAAYPPAQLAYVIEDARPPIVLSRSDVLVAGGPVDAVMSETHVVLLDRRADEIKACSTDRIPLTPFPDSLSYVIYTSGSTGRPKGTANTHRGLGNLMRWRCAQFPSRPGDAVLQRTPLGFDASVSEMIWPLISGARLVIPPADGYRDPRQWNRLIRAERVTDCHFVSSVLKVFLDELSGEPCPLQRVHLLGEEVTPELAVAARRAIPQVALHNTYGPAETAIEVTHEAVDPAGSTVPIGSPIPGVRIRVLDRQGNPVPIGVPGEVFIGGECLSRGYLNRPSLTAERFVPDPATPGARSYRTGDLAKWLPDGRLVFLGRADHQVKIRGQRIELAGVRAAVLTHPGIREAVVIARPRSSGEKELVAYLVAEGTPPPAGELRSYLLDRLPRFMVPQAFVVVPRIPLNPNGKLDRAALPDPRDGQLGVPVSRREPATAAERLMAEIWASVLGTDEIGCDDEFRELGGHSLMATQMAARISARFGVELSVAELLDRSWTLADLAGEVQRRQLAVAGRDEVLAALRRIENR